MTCHAPEQSTASHPPTHHMVSTVPRPGHPQNGDPDSIANSMAGGMGPAQAQGGGMNIMNSGHTGMVGQHRRMPMTNNMSRADNANGLSPNAEWRQ